MKAHSKKIAAPIDIIDSHSASPLRGTVVHSCRCWRVLNALGGITLWKKTEEEWRRRKKGGRSWEKLFRKTWHQTHRLVIYIFLELRIKRSLSQLMGSTFSCLALPGLESATMRAKSLTTVAGISSHSNDRV